MNAKTIKLFDFMNFFEGTVIINFLKSSLVSMIMGAIAAITTFITSYVWDSSQAVWTLVSLMIGNWAMEMYIGVHASYVLSRDKEYISPKKRAELKKRKFTVTRTFGIVFSLVLAFWLLGLAWNLSKANPMYYFMPGFVYGGFSGAYVVSVYKNMTYLGFFPKDVVRTLKEKLSNKSE